jgi:hypothetical protein
VSTDGRIEIDPRFAGFASADGGVLTIGGHRIRIDGRALSHDLLPINLLRPNEVLPRDRVNELTLIPAAGYGFQPGAGIVADLNYTLAPEGVLDYAFSCDGFLGGRGTSTLVVGGYPLVLSAEHADSALVGIANLGLAAQTPRELVAVLIPARGYVPHTANGVFSTAFNVERDGRIPFDPAALGSFLLESGASPNPSSVGEEVVVTAYAVPAGPATGTPQGTVTLSVAPVLASAPLGANGGGMLRTSALPRGEHELVVAYGGSSEFAPSSTTVRHRVN